MKRVRTALRKHRYTCGEDRQMLGVSKSFSAYLMRLGIKKEIYNWDQRICWIDKSEVQRLLNFNGVEHD